MEHHSNGWTFFQGMMVGWMGALTMMLLYLLVMAN